MKIGREHDIYQPEPRTSKRRSIGRWAAFFLVTTVVLLTGHVCDTLAAENNLSDMDITNAVESNLGADPAVAANLIDVATFDGIVTLDGKVPNLLSKQRATLVAESIRGVLAVVNTLMVAPRLRTDHEIQRDIEAALMADPAADSYEISVTVDKGIATLAGTVESRAEKQLASRVAKAVKGLKALKDEIRVKPVADRSNTEIQRDVEGRLKWNVYVDDALIDVKVTDGDVRLSGIVGSAAEKTQAIQDVWVAGVRSVDATGLQVEWWTREEMRKKEPFEPKPDEEIKKAVEKALFYDPRVTSHNVKVDVDIGEVTLMGKVDNLVAKRAAEMDARHTVGVRWVKNRLKVRSLEPVEDVHLEEEIHKALARHSLLERYEFTVSVVNQKAYLYGTVGLSLREKAG